MFREESIDNIRYQGYKKKLLRKKDWRFIQNFVKIYPIADRKDRAI